MKTIRKSIGALVLSACCVLYAQAALSAEEFKGSWTLSASEEPGKVRFGLIHRRDGGRSHHESDWPASALQGLDLAPRGRRDAQFFIARDAGRVDCSGYVADGEGAGTFRFTPDTNYAKGMRAIGFTGIDDEKQFAMAMHDVTIEFAKSMLGARLEGLDTDKLIAFRVFDLTRQFIDELRAEGLPAVSSTRLIAFRAHGVTPAMVREVRRSGLNVSEDQLIAFRVHDVTPAYIEKIEGLGYEDPQPDQLLAMKVHGVTPEFISDLQSRGMRDLSIDQLVSMRVHGID